MTTMHSGRNRARAGFTLIELVLAMGITLMVMFVAAYSISTTGGVASRANARMEVLTTGRTGLELFSADVAGAQLDSEGNLFQIFDDSYMDDVFADSVCHADTLVLTCTPSEAYLDVDGDDAFEQVQTVRVYYFMEDSALVRYDVPAESELNLAEADEWPRKALLYGIVSLSIEAYDGNAPADQDGWVGTWDTIHDVEAALPEPEEVRQYRRLPQFVRVTIRVQDTDRYMEIREDGATFELVRLMEVGTTAPAQ